MVMSVSEINGRVEGKQNANTYLLVVTGPTEKAYLDEFNVNVYPHHIALLASEKFYEMHKGRYPGVGIEKTVHIVGGRADKKGEDREGYELQGHLEKDGRGELALNENGKCDGSETREIKGANMNAREEESTTTVDGDDEGEDEFDYEEDLNEMIQLAEDLLTNFHIKCAPGTDQAIVDACREM